MKKKTFSWLLAILMFVTISAPFNKLVNAAEGDKGTLHIHKLRQAEQLPTGEGDGLEIKDAGVLKDKQPVPGVGYHIKKVANFTLADDGKTITKIEKLEAPQLLEDVFTNEEGVAVVGFKEYGRYTFQEFTLEEYEAAQRQKPAGITPNTQEYTVEFPFVQKDGSSLNVVHAYPKNVSSTGKIKIHKVLVTNPVTDEQKNHENVEFKLYVKDAKAAVEQPGKDVWREVTAQDFDKPGQFKGNSFRTGADGTITIEGLLENEYAILENSSGENYLPREPFKMGVKPAVEPVTQEFINDELLKEVSPTVQEPTYTTSETVVSVEEPYSYRVSFKVPQDVDQLDKFVLADRFQQIEEVDYAKFSDFSNLTIKVGTADVKANFQVDPVTSTVGEDTSAVVGFNAALKTEGKAAMKQYAGKTITIEAQAVVSKTYTEKKIQQAVLNDATETIERTNPFDPNHTPYKNEQKKTVPVKPAVSGLKVIKYDFADENTFLQGAKFQLYKYDEKATGHKGDKVGEEKVTSQAGEAIWEGLVPGQYVLEETAYPTYMDKGVEKTYRAVDADGLRVVTITKEELATVHTEKVANRKPEWYIPETGGEGYMFFTVTGISLILVAFVLLIKKRSENKN